MSAQTRWMIIAAIWAAACLLHLYNDGVAP